MKPNLTERQTNRIAIRMYSHLQNNWWNYVEATMGPDDDTELTDQDYLNVSKALAEMLQG